MQSHAKKDTYLFKFLISYLLADIGFILFCLYASSNLKKLHTSVRNQKVQSASDRHKQSTRLFNVIANYLLVLDMEFSVAPLLPSHVVVNITHLSKDGRCLI